MNPDHPFTYENSKYGLLSVKRASADISP